MEQRLGALAQRLAKAQAKEARRAKKKGALTQP